jgi:hypothetical protein
MSDILDKTIGERPGWIFLRPAPTTDDDDGNDHGNDGH